MRHGFVKAAAATPDIRVAMWSLIRRNSEAIGEACRMRAKIIVFPELCITGYTCGDLFTQAALLEAAHRALIQIAQYTADKDIRAVVGTPLAVRGKLYNTAAALNRGKILGLRQRRFFRIMQSFTRCASLLRDQTRRDIFCSRESRFPSDPGFCLSVRLEAERVSGDLRGCMVPGAASIQAAIEGATVIVNCSASNETIGKDAYRRELIAGQSARLIAGYVYANAGEGESTTDVVFGGHNLLRRMEPCSKKRADIK